MSPSIAISSPLQRPGKLPWLSGLFGGRRQRSAAPAARPVDTNESMSKQERWASHRAAFYRIGDGLALEAQRTRAPMTVVVFEQGDLPELRDVFGAEAVQAVVADFTAKLKVLAGASGLAVRADATAWAVLLPGHDAKATVAAVKNAMGAGLAVEAGEEILLVPRIAMHSIGEQAAPMRAIYREMREKIRNAQAVELQREEYLRRERESYTRPSTLAEAVTAPVPAMP
jgi:GGDEF domain-containing protein